MKPHVAAGCAGWVVALAEAGLWPAVSKEEFHCEIIGGVTHAAGAADVVALALWRRVTRQERLTAATAVRRAAWNPWPAGSSPKATTYDEASDPPQRPRT